MQDPNPPRLSFGRVGDRAIFMDLQDDLYFAAGAEEQDLIAAVGRPAEPIVPQASLFDQGNLAPVSLSDGFIVLTDLVGIKRSLRRRPIAKVVMGVAGTSASALTDTARAAHLAQRFAVARKVVPIPRNCLLDSIALLRWLGRDNVAATLVFGAKLDPFAAHCWVQAGDLLLTDRLEEIERFTPVRSIACAPAMS